MAFTPRPDQRPDDLPWPELAWPPADGTTLTGRTVELTPFDPERDAEELFAALDHDAVWAHVNGRWLSSSLIIETMKQRREIGWVPWVLRLVRPLKGLETGAVVGLSCYLDVSVADARLEIGSTLYTPAVWATQVNPEAKLLLLELAFEQLRAGRVQLKTDIRNQRSQRAIDRLGARFEGVLRRHARRADGTVRDSVMFAVTAEDWPTVRIGLLDRLDNQGRREPTDGGVHVPQHPHAAQLRAARDDRRGRGGGPAVRPEDQRDDEALEGQRGGVRARGGGDRRAHP